MKSPLKVSPNVILSVHAVVALRQDLDAAPEEPIVIVHLSGGSTVAVPGTINELIHELVHEPSGINERTEPRETQAVLAANENERKRIAELRAATDEAEQRAAAAAANPPAEPTP